MIVRWADAKAEPILAQLCFIVVVKESRMTGQSPAEDSDKDRPLHCIACCRQCRKSGGSAISVGNSGCEGE